VNLVSISVYQSVFSRFSSGRPLYGRYVRWKAKWLEASRCPPTVRLFILDQLLPIWISCKDCGKYRAISRDSWNAMPIAKRVGEFTCSRLESADSVHDCSVPEEEVGELVASIYPRTTHHVIDSRRRQE